jgi:hypothetical protein
MPWVIVVPTVFATEAAARGGFQSDADGEPESALARHRPVSASERSQRARLTRTVASTAALLLMGLMGAACDQPATAPSEIADPRPSGEGYQQTPAPLAGRDDVSTATVLRQWALAADAEGDVLVDVFVRRDGVLGLIVAPSATPDRVRGTIEYLVWSMARPFPGRPIELIAYQDEQEMARTVVNRQTGLPETVIVH